METKISKASNKIDELVRENFIQVFRKYEGLPSYWKNQRTLALETQLHQQTLSSIINRKLFVNNDLIYKLYTKYSINPARFFDSNQPDLLGKPKEDPNSEKEIRLLRKQIELAKMELDLTKLEQRSRNQ